MGRERDRWAELRRAVQQVERCWREDSRRFTYRTAEVVVVYLHAAGHDRPVGWACDAGNWDARDRPPPRLPDQSTMSRRTRGASFERFMAAVGAVLAGEPPDAQLCKRMDGRPLTVAAHSRDRDATWGRGAGQDGRGYKLHAVWARRPMPEQWAVAPLHVDERVVARRLVGRLEGCGYLAADALYEGNPLHRIAAAAGHQLVAPRRRPGSGLGHRDHCPQRLRCIGLLEPPPGRVTSGFGVSLLRQRAQIERDFGNLSAFGGGLHALPPWVRRIWRVRLWVHAKLLINAARIRATRKALGA